VITVTLETGRLTLKSLNKNDAEAYYNFLMRNTDFLKPWSPKYEDEYFNLSHHEKKFIQLEKDTEEGRYIKFGVHNKNDLNTIIGSVSFSSIIHGPFKSCYLGYRVDEKENGKGFATEAVKSGIDYIFNTLNLHRTEANVIPRNTASIRVVEKLGFTYEGQSKKYLQINGVWEDHNHYALINDNIK
jgi:ribosomal-protein-alanine N-acetyltransferase